MSTRAVIARRNQEGAGFEGRYHHWDGYPKGLGATLWELYHGHFRKDLGTMLQVLLDDHPAGWSTINNADWNLVPGYVGDKKHPCTVCGVLEWKHYWQNYESSGESLPQWGRKAMAAGYYLALGHRYREPDLPEPPTCFCHGDRSEEPQLFTAETAAAVGCEWAYVFDEGPSLVVLASFNDDGGKMIGMFGMGNPVACWKEVAFIPLEGVEPDWDRVECGESLERCGHVEGYHKVSGGI